jgi:hypothetical protein
MDRFGICQSLKGSANGLSLDLKRAHLSDKTANVHLHKRDCPKFARQIGLFDFG